MKTRKELEIKLELAPAGVPRLEQIPLIRALKARPRRANEVSVYFDTGKQKLHRKGLLLRVRRVGNRYIQTIKSNGNSGLFERDEWEAEIAGRAPDLSLAAGTALEPFVKHNLGRQLKPLFETRVRRTVYPLADDARAIELTIDRGTIDTGTRSVPLCEIELELKRGNMADLFEVARELTRALPARLAFKSKSDRGYELADGERGAPVNAAAIDLIPGTRTRDVFQTIGRACLKHVVDNETALINGDPEGVHQMRVGLRRLRAAISLFAALLRDPQTAAIKTELKWLARELASARELDVLLQRVIMPVTRRHPSWHGIPSLSQEFAEKRKGALTRAQNAVTSVRFHALTFETAAWLEIGRWTKPRDALVRDRGDVAIEMFAAEQLNATLAQSTKKRPSARATRCSKSPQAADPGEEAALCGGVLCQPVSGQTISATAGQILGGARASAGWSRRSQRHCRARGRHHRDGLPAPTIGSRACLRRRGADRPRRCAPRYGDGGSDRSLHGACLRQAVLAMRSPGRPSDPSAFVNILPRRRRERHSAVCGRAHRWRRTALVCAVLLQPRGPFRPP